MPPLKAQPPIDAPVTAGFLGPDRNWHLSAGAVTAVTVIAFAIWSFGHAGAGVSPPLLLLAIAFGLFMAFNIGGNDVANSFGTSVGAGTLTMKQALMVAAVFEVSGAVLAGSSVTETVRSGIVDIDSMHVDPQSFVYIMMSALLGAAVWLLLATKMGWPVSTTHAIIGGIVGAAVTTGLVTGTGGLEMVQWGEIGQIAISWILSRCSAASWPSCSSERSSATSWPPPPGRSPWDRTASTMPRTTTMTMTTRRTKSVDTCPPPSV